MSWASANNLTWTGVVGGKKYMGRGFFLTFLSVKVHKNRQSQGIHVLAVNWLL